MRSVFELRLLSIVVVVGLSLVGCDQQQPIAQQQRADPGVKPGETPPVELDQGPQRNRDGNVPLPPATASTTPGEPNSPAAPFVPPPPTTPTPSPTEAPATSLQVPP